MKLMSLHRAWTIWTVALLAILTLSGCGGNVSIPDTPDAAITEAQKKVKVATDAETAKSAKVGELWTDASSTYKAVQDKFKNSDVGYTGAIESARIMSDKKKETYNAWKQLDAYLRSTEMKSAKREEALTLLLELETKQNDVNAKTPYFKVMDTLVRIFGNNKKFSPVLAIVFIAIFVTGILWPLRYKTFKNAKEMQKYAPQIKDLNEKYKANPAELQAKMKEFQLEHGVNPMGGCLPALAQIPVFLLMIQLINNYQFSFRDATFLWITPAFGDLSQLWPAPLKGQIGHHLGEQDIILLVLYAGTMFVQMKLSPPPTDPTQAEQQKMMSTTMPVIYFVMMLQYQLPSAFVLYYFASNILGVGQQWLIQRQLNAAAAGTTVIIEPGKPAINVSNPLITGKKKKK